MSSASPDTVAEALKNDDIDALKLALASRPTPDLSRTDAEGLTPLDHALAKSPAFLAPEMARMLVTQGAMPGTGETCPALALSRLALSCSPSLPPAAIADAKLPNGFTPFLWAAVLAPGTEWLERLLAAGADLKGTLPPVVADDPKAEGDDALLLSARWNPNPDIVRLLLSKGLDANRASPFMGTTPLMTACRAGNLEAVESLLEAGAKVNASDGVGSTPFLIAAGRADMKLMKRLVAAGADPAAVPNGGRTALHSLIQHGADLESVDWLLSLGVPVNESLSCDFDEQTPLMLAVRHAKPSAAVISALLNKGADPSLRDIEGRRAVDGLPTERVLWLKRNGLYHRLGGR